MSGFRNVNFWRIFFSFFLILTRSKIEFGASAYSNQKRSTSHITWANIPQLYSEKSKDVTKFFTWEKYAQNFLRSLVSHVDNVFENIVSIINLIFLKWKYFWRICARGFVFAFHFRRFSFFRFLCNSVVTLQLYVNIYFWKFTARFRFEKETSFRFWRNAFILYLFGETWLDKGATILRFGLIFSSNWK